MVSPQTSLFHNYASVSCSAGFGGVVGDHCLQSDLRHLYSSSPNLTMYEPELADSTRSLTGSTSDSLGDIAQLEDLDCNSESLKLDLDSLCPSFVEDSYIRGDAVWSPTEPSLLKMEDVFQVDKNDVIQGPTLAQLNSTDSITLLDDIALVLGNDLDPQKGFPWVPTSQALGMPSPRLHQRTCTVTSPSGLSIMASGMESPPQPPLQLKQEPPFHISAKFSVYAPSPTATAPAATTPTLMKLSPSPACSKKPLLQEYLSTPSFMSSLSQNLPGQAVKMPQMPTIKQEPIDFENLSSQSMDRKWEEIKQFIDDDENKAAAIRAVVAAAAARLSPKLEPKDVAYSPSEESSAVKTEEDEGEMSCDDAASEADTLESEYDHAEFLLSEAESDSEDGGKPVGRKQKRYFWQYNTQAKGPKGKRLCKSVTNCDPHVLNDFEDPVFDPDLNQMSYKHNGKARKGDGNDITPNPYKLFQIGQELKKLTRIINELRPVNELPVNVRSRSRKEKNKLASRACRLKKKAQHEANKLKLYGLEREHKSLMKMLNAVKKNFVETIDNKQIVKEIEVPYLEIYNDYLQQHMAGKVAGHTARYVNTVLAKVSSGDPTGGINI